VAGRGVTQLRVGLVLGVTAGGTGAHAAMLARGLAARGVAVSAFGPAELRDRLGFEPASFAAVPIGDRPRPAADAAALLRLRGLLAGAGLDVVHAHGLRAGAFAALALAGRPGARGRGHGPALVVTVHNAAPAGAAQGAVYRVLELIVARRADLVLSVSEDLAARMRSLRARETGRALVPAPAAAPATAQAVAAARADIGAADGRPVLLTAARMAAQKGYPVLLEAAAAWQRRDPVPVLAIAGDGPLAAEIAAGARDRHLDVVLLGHRDDVGALLEVADVAVVPSLWEGQPLFVQQALRAGRPLVATRAGGTAELTGPDAALLVPPGDPGALAAAVLSVLDDPGLAASLRAAALARAAALPSESDAIDAALAAYGRLGGACGRRG
jgi:glycosyltransferase involved in cell wall biosynthesis